MTNSHRSAKRAIILFFSRVVPSLGLLGISIWFSRTLPVDLYGQFQQLWVAVIFSATLSAFGFPTFILAFYSRIQRADLQSLIRQLLWVLPVISIILTLYFGFTNHLKSFMTWGMLGLLFVSQGVYLVQESLLVVRQREHQLAVLNGLYTVLLVLFHGWLLQSGFKMDVLIAGLALLSVFRNGFLLAGHKPSDVAQSDLTLRMHTSQWIWTGVNDSLNGLSKWSDKLIIMALMTSADFAIYVNGTLEVPMIALLTSSVFAVITERMGVNMDAHPERAARFFKAGTTLMAGLIFPLTIWLFVEADRIIPAIFGSPYTESVVFFQVYCWIMLVRIASFTGLVQVYGLAKDLIKGTLLDLGTIALGLIILYPWLGAVGLAASVVAGTMIQASFYMISVVKASGHPIQDFLNIRQLALRLIIPLMVLSAYGWLDVKGWTGLITTGFMSVAIMGYFLWTDYQSIRPHSANVQA